MILQWNWNTLLGTMSPNIVYFWKQSARWVYSTLCQIHNVAFIMGILGGCYGGNCGGPKEGALLLMLEGAGQARFQLWGLAGIALQHQQGLLSPGTPAQAQQHHQQQWLHHISTCLSFGAALHRPASLPAALMGCPASLGHPTLLIGLGVRRQYHGQATGWLGMARDVPWPHPTPHNCPQREGGRGTSAPH